MSSASCTLLQQPFVSQGSLLLNLKVLVSFDFQRSIVFLWFALVGCSQLQKAMILRYVSFSDCNRQPTFIFYFKLIYYVQYVDKLIFYIVLTWKRKLNGLLIKRKPMCIVNSCFLEFEVLNISFFSVIFLVHVLVFLFVSWYLRICDFTFHSPQKPKIGFYKSQKDSA